MNTKAVTWVLCIMSLFLPLSVYSISNLHEVNAQINNWKKYSDPGQKFNFAYPPNWEVKGTHDNTTGTTEVILNDPNSTRTQVSMLYNPNDSLLNSKTNKPVVPSRALTNLEMQIRTDYVFFNSTGKFPHKYSIQNYQSASDIVDYEKSKGKPGEMLIVFAKINDKDSYVFTYSDSKRLFYKGLSNISKIIKSIEVG